MAELKTRPGGGSVRDFLAGVQPPELEEPIQACVEHLRGGR
jgi:hypothetical protein